MIQELTQSMEELQHITSWFCNNNTGNLTSFSCFYKSCLCIINILFWIILGNRLCVVSSTCYYWNHSLYFASVLFKVNVTNSSLYFLSEYDAYSNKFLIIFPSGEYCNKYLIVCTYTKIPVVGRL